MVSRASVRPQRRHPGRDRASDRDIMIPGSSLPLSVCQCVCVLLSTTKLTYYKAVRGARGVCVFITVTAVPTGGLCVYYCSLSIYHDYKSCSRGGAQWTLYAH